MTEIKPTGVPEDRIAKILERAAEIDRLPATVRPEMIRAAAVEAGISPDAIDRALAEFEATGLEPIAAPAAPAPVEHVEQALLTRIWKTLTHPIGLVVIALFIGAATEEADIGVAIGMMLFAAKGAAAALRHARDYWKNRKQRSGAHSLTA